MSGASRKLTREDYASFDRSWIPRTIVDEAAIYRVPHLDAKDILAGHHGADLSGIVFPYRMPGEKHSVLERVRLDHPPIGPDGKPEHKYLTARTSRNRLYFPPCSPELLTDLEVPVVITEGEKKCLALWRAALESMNGNNKPTFLPVAIAGVWSWKGTIGDEPNSNGKRVPVKGPIPDLERIQWGGRKVTLLFDANASTNFMVSVARRELARELTKRSAEVCIAELPAGNGINGCDDFLALHGLAQLLSVLKCATPYEWRAELIRTEKGKIIANVANAITALRSAPDWIGVLALNEFTLEVATIRDAPWGPVKSWTNEDDTCCAEWLQHHGIGVREGTAAAAVQVVARDRPFHPVRDYLDGLEWDKISRIDDWLTLYMSVEPSDYVRAVAARWLISAVARIYSPGCQADHCLILEGGQGTKKSTAVNVLANGWFADDLAEVGTRDGAMSTFGVWILELSELDAIRRVKEMSRVKSFISRRSDHIRPPYGRRFIDHPRQCVFVGTDNHFDNSHWDDTGGRRFWWVTTGKIDLATLERDRNQLWAEAVARYRAGGQWWLQEDELITAATEEQEARYAADPWEAKIQEWLGERTQVTVSDILKAMEKPIKDWGRFDEMRVGVILRRLNWKPRGRVRPRVYVPMEQV